MLGIWHMAKYIYADRSSFDELLRVLFGENPVDVVGQPCHHNGETTQPCDHLLLTSHIICNWSVHHLENNAADIPDQICYESLL